MSSNKLLTVLRRRGGASWIESNALLYDTFATDASAPLTSPRTCEPGPGTLTIVDTGNNSVITGGEWKVTGIADAGDPGLYRDYATGSRFSAGTTLYARLKAKNAADRYRFGFDIGGTDTPNNGAILKVLNTRTDCLAQTGHNATPAVPFVDDAYYDLAIVVRDAGYYFIKNGELIWVEGTETVDVDAINLAPYNAAEDTRCSEIALLPLADYNVAWGGDFTEVTDTISAPAAQNNAFLCAVNYSLSCDFTFEIGKYVQVSARHADSDNQVYWQASTTGGFTVYEKVLGSSNLLYSSGGTFADGVAANVTSVHEGNTLKVYKDNVLLCTVTTNAALTSTGGYSADTLATNDIELTTHPYPALGIADSRIVCPQNSDTATMSYDAVIELKNLVLPVGNTDGFFYRRTDANNYSRLNIDPDGSFELRDRVGGVFSDRLISGALGALSNDDNIVLVADGVNLEMFVNGTSVGSSSGSTLNLGTGILYSSGDGMTFDHITCYPRDVSSLLPEGTY
jgi:hypothetical protein